MRDHTQSEFYVGEPSEKKELVPGLLDRYGNWTANDDNAVCKTTKTAHFIKYGLDSLPLNPQSPYFDVAHLGQVDRPTGRPKYQYRHVGPVTYANFVEFLMTGRKSYYNAIANGDPNV